MSTWIGISWGASDGPLRLSLAEENGRLSGTGSIVENGFGETKFSINGTLKGSHLNGVLSEFSAQTPDVQLPKSGTMTAILADDKNSISGEWDTDLGNHGRFAVLRSFGPPEISNQQKQQIPALIVKNITLGSYRLGNADLRRLALIIREGTNVPETAINVTAHQTSHVHIGIDNAVADPNIPNVAYELLLQASEPAINNGSRVATLILKRNDPNTLSVSGPDQIWVEGKAAAIQAFLKEHETRITRFLRSYGPQVNSVIFLLLIALLPSISLIWQRLVIIGLVFALLLLLLYFWKLAANTKVYFRSERQAWHEKYESLWVAVLAVVLGGGISYLIARFTATHVQ